jgi:hypothetical protein
MIENIIKDNNKIGVSIEECLPIIKSMSYTIFNKYRDLYNYIDINCYRNEVVYRIMRKSRRGVRYIDTYNKNKYTNISVTITGFLYKIMKNIALDIIFRNQRFKKLIVFENQYIKNNDFEEDKLISIYDNCKSDDYSDYSTLINDILNRLPNTSNQKIFIDGIGEISYTFYWVMRLHLMGYTIADISNFFGISEQMIRRKLVIARDILKGVIKIL